MITQLAWQSRKWLVIPILLFLSACSQESEMPLAIQNGLYIPTEIKIEYSPQPINTPTNAPDSIDSLLIQKIEQSYYEIKDDQFIIYTADSDDTGILTPDNIAIMPKSSYLLAPNADGSITARNQNIDECRPHQCTLSFTLLMTDLENPKIIEIENHAQETINNNVPIILDIPEEEILSVVDEPFWGVVHAITDDLVVKLSPAQSNGLDYGIPEHTELATFQIGGLTIDPTSDAVEVLSFYTNDEPSSAIHQVNTYSYLFILDTDEPLNINLTKIRPENYRYLSLDNGFIAEDNNGFYAINYHYFPKIKKSIIALTEGLELIRVIEHFRALETIENRNASEFTSLLITPYEISLQDLKLALTTLENRYNVTLDQQFRLEEIHHNYREKISDIIKSQDIFVKEGPNTAFGYHRFIQPIGDYRFKETFIRLHNDDIKNVIKAVRAANRQENGQSKTHDLWVSPIYIYSIQPNQASGLSYFKEIQPGVTLEIFSPAAQGHIAEKVLFGKMLQQLDVSKIPDIPKAAIPNIAKYTLPTDLADTDTEVSITDHDLQPIFSAPESDSDSEKHPSNNSAQAQADDDTQQVDTQSDSTSLLEKQPEQKRYHFKEGSTDLNGHLL